MRMRFIPLELTNSDGNDAENYNSASQFLDLFGGTTSLTPLLEQIIIDRVILWTAIA
jgi:hypothetical protein